MKPKYNVGDKVYIINCSKKIQEIEITGIRKGITYKKEPIFYYGFFEPQEKYGTIYIQEEENEVFATKEELITSL